MNREELAWAAGFFDGEGTTSLHGYRGSLRSYPRVTIVQKDPQLLRRLAAAVPIPSALYTVNRTSGPMSMLYFNGYERSQAFIAILWTWLGAPKRLQAKAALTGFVEQCLTKGHGPSWRTHCAKGHEYTPENSLPRSDSSKSRRCRRCHRENTARARMKAKVKNGQTWTLPPRD